MKRIWLISVSLLLLFIGCGMPAVVVPTVPTYESNIVKLSQSIIDAAIADCKDNPNWGIDLPEVRINYVTGVVLKAVVVLHNGNDSERLVKIECEPTFVTYFDQEKQVTYQPSPFLVKQWLKPDETQVRLAKMETRVVWATLYVPSDITNLPKTWEVDLNVDGMPIEPYEQKMIVTTEDNDTILTFHLNAPLMEGTKSVLNIKSAIDEQPYVLSYDSVKGLLTIGGLKSNQQREITVTYEPMSSQTIAYGQRWLITMMR